MLQKTLIVVPHYGPDELIHQVLESAGFALPAGALQTDVAEIHLTAFSFFIVNNNRMNRGFTAACNLGLKQVRDRSRGFAFAWLLNNDTAFESKEQFERALAWMQAIALQKDWAIVGQQVLNYSARDQIVFGGARECFPAGRHKSGLRSRGDWAVASEEKWLSFCSVLIRRDLVDRIGLMDENLFNYYSDSDYSLRARDAGFKIGYSGAGSFVFHKIGQSSRPGEEQLRVMQRDYLTFWKKWIAGSQHSTYMKLMGKSAGCTAGDLLERAQSYPELVSWLNTLAVDQRIDLQDILEHYQHQTPATPFSILCNVTRELVETTVTR